MEEKIDYNAINFRNKDIDKFSTKFGNGDPIFKKKSIDEKIEAVDTNPRLNRVVERRYERVDAKMQKAEGHLGKMNKLNDKYGYNYKAAKEAGIQPDETGHWGSIGNDGLILKGPKHPSMIKTKKVEKILGNKIVKKDGQLYSVPKKK
jgi:hypothetical protein